MEHAAELAAALAEYRSQRATHWAQGRAMSYEQAIAFALKPEREKNTQPPARPAAAGLA